MVVEPTPITCVGTNCLWSTVEAEWAGPVAQ